MVVKVFCEWKLECKSEPQVAETKAVTESEDCSATQSTSTPSTGDTSLDLPSSAFTASMIMDDPVGLRIKLVVCRIGLAISVLPFPVIASLRGVIALSAVTDEVCVLSRLTRLSLWLSGIVFVVIVPLCLLVVSLWLVDLMTRGETLPHGRFRTGIPLVSALVMASLDVVLTALAWRELTKCDALSDLLVDSSYQSFTIAEGCFIVLLMFAAHTPMSAGVCIGVQCRGQFSAANVQREGPMSVVNVQTPMSQFKLQCSDPKVSGQLAFSLGYPASGLPDVADSNEGSEHNKPSYPANAPLVVAPLREQRGSNCDSQQTALDVVMEAPRPVWPIWPSHWRQNPTSTVALPNGLHVSLEEFSERFSI